jgi:hypothetical protein
MASHFTATATVKQDMTDNGEFCAELLRNEHKSLPRSRVRSRDLCFYLARTIGSQCSPQLHVLPHHNISVNQPSKADALVFHLLLSALAGGENQLELERVVLPF